MPVIIITVAAPDEAEQILRVIREAEDNRYIDFAYTTEVDNED